MSVQALKRVLLVEDDSRDAELALNVLAEDGFADEIAIARDGVEALDYLYCVGTCSGRSGGRPAAILLDLKLPRLDGFEVLRQLKSDAAMRTLPVIILTSSREDRDLSECYRLGANAYVVKPVEFGEFARTVKRVVEFWARVNQPPPGSGGWSSAN